VRLRALASCAPVIFTLACRGKYLRTNIVLIDYESVQPASLDLLAGEHFKLIVFVGATQNKLPFDLVTAMQRFGDRAEYVKIAGVGPNALDFHIAYYIGKLAVSDPGAFFHIISKDGGFDPLIQHLKAQKILSARWAAVEDIPVVKSSLLKSPEDRAALFLARLLQPKATKPRTERTLRSAIASHFQKQLSEEEISEVIGAMQTPGHVSLSDGKVIYAQSG
jgi:hypothetical protein